METLIGLCLLAVVGWLVWSLWLSDEKPNVQTELPERLKSAAIWGKEKPLRLDDPVGLSAQLDEAFLTNDGVVVLSETKSRARPVIYNSDILQLSAYKMIIERQERKAVDRMGYVRLLTGEGNMYKPVRLLDEAEVIAAVRLHEDLSSGAYKGSKCGKAGVCRSCAYKKECDEEL